MHAYSSWNIDASQILSREELATVLSDLKKRATRLPNIQMNLAILRLACCCGLRASEVGGLRLGDVLVDIGRPHLMVRADYAKLNRPRRVPLWWDEVTLADLTEWCDYRYRQGARRDDPSFAPCSARLTEIRSIATSCVAASTLPAAYWDGIDFAR